MSRSAIEWTDETWNPTTGCDRVSPGCDNCYALTMARRLKAMGQPKYQRDGDPRTSGPGFGLTTHVDVVELPLTWSSPRMVFVNSMSDLFHQEVPDDFIARVFAVMSEADRHVFQILTKRPQRMAQLLTRWARLGWEPSANVWLGTSIENDRYTFRAQHLRATPAAVRFLSLEPLLGPLPSLALDGISWVIVGGESGTGARPMEPEWVRSLRDACVDAGVPFFFKQWGTWLPYEEDPQAPFWLGQDDTLVDGHVLPAQLSEGDPVAGWWAPDCLGAIFRRVGKTRAGRLLDGRTWDEMPALVGA